MGLGHAFGDPEPGQDRAMADELIDVLVESPKGSRIKYEWDEERGAIRFDRHLYSATMFPADYGYVADALGADGEKLDALILTDEGTFPGCWVLARPIGVFWIAYDDQREAKILAVADQDPNWEEIVDVDDLPAHRRDEISHFFDVYKDLEPGRNPSSAGYEGRKAALKVVAESRQAAREGK
jgi:inorganic pyrophosphatase